MVSLTKMGYCSLTNFSSFLTKNRFSFQKIQRLLFHSSLTLDGPGKEIKMPSLSPTMSEGKIVKWLKKEGDPINPGDVLCDIETDKAVVSMETEEEGILAKILVPENSDQVKVGSLIALMVDSEEDWRNVDIPSSVIPPDNSNDTAISHKTQSLSSNEVSSGPPSIQIKMPSLSPTMSAGNIVKWHKKEGDIISPGDALCDVETDKAIMPVETEEDGILAKILFPNDSQNIEVGALIALIVPQGEDWKSVVVPTSSKQDKTVSSQSLPKKIDDKKIKNYGPAVKLLLSSYQIEPNIINPSGKGGRILKGDVLKYIKEKKLEKISQKLDSVPVSQTKAPEPKLPKQTKISTIKGPKYTDIELTNMRKTIAKRLLQSKREIPHSYSVMKCNANNLLEMKENLSKKGIKVSLNDLIVKSTALALQIYPKANALCINNELKVCNYVDVSVAVATKSGLYTPIIKSTNLKSVVQISKEMKQLAEKAKSGKLLPEEFSGGTFTISNLGMFNITHFKAIINPPQCGLLAVGGTTLSLDPDLKIQKNITFTLSYDGRAMNEYEAAEFMETLKHVIDNPKLTLVGTPAFPRMGL